MDRTTQLQYLYSLYRQSPKVQTDTRKIAPGEIYFALKGEQFDGNQFVAQALEAGATFAVVDDPAAQINDRCILVEDVLTTLQQLAAFHRGQMNAKILAITGTNGKTTTKELVSTVLSTQYNIIYTEGNLNNHIGVPLTLLRIKEDTEIAVVEMGANHVGEIASYCTWAKPDYGIITNIGKAHLEGFGSLEGVKTAKSELYKAVAKYGKMIFRYNDTPFLEELTPEGLQVFTYGKKDAQVCGAAMPRTVQLQVNLTQPQDFEGVYTTQLVGQYNLPNVLCAIAVGVFFNVGKENIQNAIAAYAPSNSRSQLLKKGSNTIILDAYNANPSSMTLALDNLAELNLPNKWVLLGAMKELGANSDEEHARIARHAMEHGFKQVLLVGEEYRRAGIAHYPIFKTSEDLCEFLMQHPIHNGTILIKGSRGSAMEKVLPAFE